MRRKYDEFSMEMPTTCDRCDCIFDLEDGYESKLWYPGTIICPTCHNDEMEEMLEDGEIPYCDSEEDGYLTAGWGNDDDDN